MVYLQSLQPASSMESSSGRNSARIRMKGTGLNAQDTTNTDARKEVYSDDVETDRIG